MARMCRAKVVLNTDSHAPQDLVGIKMAREIAAGAGMMGEEISRMFKNSEVLVRKAVNLKTAKS